MSASFLATVMEHTDGSQTTMRVPEAPDTAQGLRKKLKVQRIASKQTKCALQEAVAQEPSEPKRFKRASWAEGAHMSVSLEGLTTVHEVPVLMTDTWSDVKAYACTMFEVQPDQYCFEYKLKVCETRAVKGKTVSTRVGELPIWDGCLVLRQLPAPHSPPSSSGSSSSS